jgi:hypothetical protein
MCLRTQHSLPAFITDVQGSILGPMTYYSKLPLSWCFSVSSAKFRSSSSNSPTTATSQTLCDLVLPFLQFDSYKPISRPHVDATFLGTVFRRVGKNAKSDYQLRYVCLLSVCSSVSPYGTTRFPLDGFL